ncbi:hypothetical protein L682_27230 [Aquipseudomonas alcaligenes OT 69]|nr:hypothetical protein L682_27230 [Pseudomonas alcaligenes OT 69]
MTRRGVLDVLDVIWIDSGDMTQAQPAPFGLCGGGVSGVLDQSRVRGCVHAFSVGEQS